METFSALLAICAGNSPVPGEFPAQRPVTRNFNVCIDLRLNKQLSKQHEADDLRRYRGNYDVTALEPKYSGRTRLTPQSCYLMCRIKGSLFSVKTAFNCVSHLSYYRELKKIDITISFFTILLIVIPEYMTKFINFKDSWCYLLLRLFQKFWSETIHSI